MRVAALYDIHGNFVALEAVLAEIHDLRPDLVVIGGDVVAGPFPEPTLERLQGLGEKVRFVQGNADREIVEAALERPAGISEEKDEIWRARARWAASRLSAEQIDFLAGLPDSIEVDVDGLGPALFCHGTPRSDEEIMTRITPEARVAEILDGVEQNLVICGHVHVQYDRRVGRWRVVNAGSVGLAYEGTPGARWALLGPGVELRTTPYDPRGVAEAIRRSDFPGAEDYAQRFILQSLDSDTATTFFEEMAAKRTRTTAGR